MTILAVAAVSIPNGDRHYLEQQRVVLLEHPTQTFQSPMGIGITSNNHKIASIALTQKFQSPMGIGITSNGMNAKPISN